jgi:hypothetical protein
MKTGDIVEFTDGKSIWTDLFGDVHHFGTVRTIENNMVQLNEVFQPIPIDELRVLK